MKKVFALTLATLLSVPAFASNNVKFVGVDSDFATELCVTAAESGLIAAKKQARKVEEMGVIEFYSTTCNGQKIRDFAEKFETTTESIEANAKVIYQFKLVDNSIESQTCAVAAKEGYKAALKFGGSRAKAIVCNGKSLNRFARQYTSI